jgi:hypothetical protein
MGVAGFGNVTVSWLGKLEWATVPCTYDEKSLADLRHTVVCSVEDIDVTSVPGSLALVDLIQTLANVFQTFILASEPKALHVLHQECPGLGFLEYPQVLFKGRGPWITQPLRVGWATL